MIDFLINYMEYTLLSFTWLFIAFVFVMKFKHKTKKGTWQRTVGMWLMGYPFILADFWVNIVISLAFFDPPRKLELVTGRMQRYKLLDMNKSFLNKWRYESAWFICKLLNQHDKNHC